MKGQIIIVNGTSGSGKSTTCELFVKRANDFWLSYGIDHFLGSTFPAVFGHRGERCDEGIYTRPVDENDPEGPVRWHFTEQGMRAFGVFHEWMATASREGCNIIVDHIMLLDPAILQDCIWRLKGLPVLFVNLKPSYEVLMERIAKRQIGERFNTSYSDEQVEKINQHLQRMRPWFYEAAYANDEYDIEISSEQHTPESVCECIEQRLAEGPGQAFDVLRKRYPK